ncbi:phosphonoacetaldehyde reductase [Actinoallomurus spadix]|uniref:Iron-containing alcohol dehydrogenase n=1 Tax=Actinoallomurus spadix TaxID=79912 RepID=A0ABN0W192_9ACTN|nr:phosphonoacetaldehyde reductase [Actinoallomurus spadix]MCO5985357.1 phosphonoacetaldehyde reductase [Actinoallomurus spadix]
MTRPAVTRLRLDDPKAAPLTVLSGGGASRLAGEIVTDRGARRVLVVASESGFVRTGLREVLSGDGVRLFSGFSPNPRLEQALRGCAVRDDWDPQAIVAVGGGSALDTAKLIRALPADPAAARAVVDGRSGPPGRPRVPLVAIPTTAGTGSEVTRFATVFVDGEKRSLDHGGVRPDVALVDPDLLRGCPPEVAYPCAFDAYCHAVESFWSRRSTPASREAARTALRLMTPILLTADFTALRPADRAGLATAACAAGRAIDVTRTTAAHAFAYRLTIRHGVPHGLACLLNLRWVLEYNARRAGTACQDARGAAYLRDRLAELDGLIGAATPAALLARAGLPDRLGAYGVTARADVEALATAGLGHNRSAGNPVALTLPGVLDELMAIR